MMEVEAPTPSNGVTRVTITDIDISIGSIMLLMLKACIAAIPVAILVWLATVFLGGLPVAGMGGLR